MSADTPSGHEQTQEIKRSDTSQAKEHKPSPKQRLMGALNRFGFLRKAEQAQQIEGSAIVALAGNTGATTEKGRETGENPLESLLERLRQEVPRAITHPITPLMAYFEFYGLSAGSEIPPPKDFTDASLTIPLVDIDKLTPDQFRRLQVELHALSISTFAAAGVEPPARILHRLDPESETNIIEHERDHLGVLPEGARQDARIVVSFIDDEYHSSSK